MRRPFNNNNNNNNNNNKNIIIRRRRRGKIIDGEVIDISALCRKCGERPEETICNIDCGGKQEIGSERIQRLKPQSG